MQTLNNHTPSNPENGRASIVAAEQSLSKSENEVVNQAVDEAANGSERQASIVPVATQSTPQSSWFEQFWQWTGFSERTLFDWLQIISSIAVPVILGILSYQLSAQQAKMAEENQRSALIADYYDQMQNLLIEEKLRNSSPDSEERSMGRAMTLSTLRQVSGEQKGDLLKFLYEARLLGGQCQFDALKGQYNQCKTAIIDLKGARLEGISIDPSNPLPLAGIDLKGTSLPHAKLPEILLSRASMNGINLTAADLTEAQLNDAQLEKAILDRADLANATLVRANLKNANLKDADLTNADLSGADLRGADLTGATLKGVKFNNALYDSKTKLPGFSPSPVFNPDREGMLLK